MLTKELSLIYILSIMCIISTSYANNRFNWDAYENSIMKLIRAKNQVHGITRKDRDLPTYDYVVVGAGSAGCTLVANLLKSNTLLRILLIEAGESGDLEVNIRNYAFADKLKDTKYDWADRSVPQKNLNNQSINLSTAKVLGGCSSHNVLFWMRGDKNDYNEWAALANDNIWSYQNMEPIFKSLETYKDGSIYRGHHGDVYVSRHFTKNSFSERFMREFINSGLTYNDDYNSGNPEGVSFLQLNVKLASDGVGVRQDAFRSQLTKYLNNPRLHVLIRTVVDRVELNAQKEVKYLIIQRRDGTFKIRARRDVIISAGALRSPLILMRSGIGDCSILSKLGINCKVNLIGVGNNLRDHGKSFQYYSLDLRKPFQNVYIETVLKQVETAVEGLTHPNHQISTVFNAENPAWTFFGVLISSILFHPKSSGTVRMKSKNFLEKPIVDPKYLDHPDDLKDHIELNKVIWNIGKRLIRSGLVVNRLAPNFTLNTDQDFERSIRRNFLSTSHFGGTCKMGVANDPSAVVDSKLRVFGVKGLRVADNSIMPSLTSGNMNQPAMAIGAKCAEILLHKSRY